MNIKDLKSLEIRKRLNAKHVHFRWHNKNSTGGNFGINILGVNGKDYEISGRYNEEGTLRSMRFGDIYECGKRFDVNTIEDMFEYIEKDISSEDHKK